MSTLIDAPQTKYLPSVIALSDVPEELELQFRPTPAWKRTIDVVLACILIVALSPVLLGVSLFIRCVSAGPTFFVQSRVGANGRRFRMWKFRTMTQETDQKDHLRYVASLTDSGEKLKKLDVSSRLIPCGAWLRASAVDELPQLFNVLRGDMSLVGPRPDVLDIEDYRPFQRRRFEVVPGITGLWQVSGKNDLTFDEMLTLDAAYVDRRSFWLDMAILMKTIPVVLRMNTG